MATDSDLNDWLKAARLPVLSAGGETVARLRQAPKDGEFIQIIYNGGSSPGAARSILPRKLFTVRGYESQIYVEAYCDLRKGARVFRLDRLTFADENQVPKLVTKPKPKTPSKPKPKTPPKPKSSTHPKPGPRTRPKPEPRTRPRPEPWRQQPKPSETHRQKDPPSSGAVWLILLAIGLILLLALS